jgi:hypothetical protein
MRKITQTSNFNDNKLDCETIIRKSGRWVLKSNEFNAKEEFEKVLNSIRNEQSFLCSLIYYLSNAEICSELDSDSDSDSSVSI